LITNKKKAHSLVIILSLILMIIKISPSY